MMLVIGLIVCRWSALDEIRFKVEVLRALSLIVCFRFLSWPPDVFGSLLSCHPFLVIPSRQSFYPACLCLLLCGCYYLLIELPSLAALFCMVASFLRFSLVFVCVSCCHGKIVCYHKRPMLLFT